MTQEEAFHLMDRDDHAIWSPEQGRDIAEAFGYPVDNVPIRIEEDERSKVKGLRLWGTNPDTGEEYKEGDSAFTVDPLSLLRSMCLYFKTEAPESYFGRGSQHREYVKCLKDHFLPPKGGE